MKYGILGLAAAGIWYGVVAPPQQVTRAGGARTTPVHWEWSGRLAAGKTIAIHGINGDVAADLASGDAVQVSAELTGRRSDPAEVRLVVVEHDGGVTVCAVYPGARGRAASCDADGLHNSNVNNNDVSVDFTVHVPRGVNFEGNTVNGGVEATRLTGAASISTVNGNARLETSNGDGSAETVNGSVTATVGAGGSQPLRFKTVNGSINLTLPAALGADLDARTVNGSITSDFAIAVSGRMSPRHVAGRIGPGGRVLEAETVNGSIRLIRTP